MFCKHVFSFGKKNFNWIPPINMIFYSTQYIQGKMYLKMNNRKKKRLEEAYCWIKGG